MIRSSRRHFVQLLTAGTGFTLLAPAATLALPATAQPGKEKPAPLAVELVKEFVSKAHSDLDRVKVLLAQEPGLLNAAWDWGGGDFETALEAAGHTGRADIAQLLLQNGARLNLFCAAMLGHLDLVRATLTALPELKNSKGPHGLMLLHHARKGGAAAAPVLHYLESIGAS
jgi:hypothetical protein